MEIIKLSDEFMDEFYRKHPEYVGVEYDWCDCGHEGDPVFHDDNVTPWESCVRKHHYHCPQCLGLSQIG